jgi:peroxiredoxin
MASTTRQMCSSSGVLSLLLTAVLMFTVVLTADAARIESGEPARDFALKSIAGENLRLSEYRGRVVMLSIFADWCGRCKQQLPELIALDRSYRDAGLQVLGVGLDEDRDHLLSADRASDFPILHDGDKRIARLYDTGKLPMTLMIDRHGEVRHVHQGFRSADVEQYVSQLEALLAE